MSEPVCIYFSKEGCPACDRFNPEWQRAVQRVGNRYRMMKYTCNSVNRPPGPFATYVNYFPTVILCSSAQYNFFFDNYGRQRNFQNATIPAVKFNAVQRNGTYAHAGKLDNADNLISWLDSQAPRFMAK
ncbi:MAG: hypothetical protein ACYCQJ_14230 [Nitrososphaerales archaeon]